jgi:tetratricopeptide (TPR) repeat protein
VLAFFQGDLVIANDRLAEAAQAAQAATEVLLEAQSLAFLGWVARERGDPAAGLVPLEKSRALLKQLTDPWERSEVLMPLASATVEAEVSMAREVLALKRETGDIIGISDSLNNVGWEDLHAGELDRAISNLEEGLAIARQLQDTFRITLAACNLGLAAVMQHRCADAIPPLRESLVLSIRRGDRRCGAEAVLGLAAATAGLNKDELSVELDTIQRTLLVDAGVVYPSWMLERLEPYLLLARTRISRDRTEASDTTAPEATLERALELLDASENENPDAV